MSRQRDSGAAPASVHDDGMGASIFYRQGYGASASENEESGCDEGVGAFPAPASVPAPSASVKSGSSGGHSVPAAYGEGIGASPAPAPAPAAAVTPVPSDRSKGRKQSAVAANTPVAPYRLGGDVKRKLAVAPLHSRTESGSDDELGGSVSDGSAPESVFTMAPSLPKSLGIHQLEAIALAALTATRDLRQASNKTGKHLKATINTQGEHRVTITALQASIAAETESRGMAIQEVTAACTASIAVETGARIIAAQIALGAVAKGFETEKQERETAISALQQENKALRSRSTKLMLVAFAYVAEKLYDNKDMIQSGAVGGLKGIYNWTTQTAIPFATPYGDSFVKMAKPYTYDVVVSLYNNAKEQDLVKTLAVSTAISPQIMAGIALVGGTCVAAITLYGAYNIAAKLCCSRTKKIDGAVAKDGLHVAALEVQNQGTQAVKIHKF